MDLDGGQPTGLKAPVQELAVQKDTALQQLLVRSPKIGEEALEGPGSARALVTVGAILSGLMLARVLVSGHQIGTRLRATRRRHRDLVEIGRAHV